MRIIMSLLLLLATSPLAAESLASKLEAKAAASKARGVSNNKLIMEQAAKELADSDILVHAPKVGEVLPDGELVSADGSKTSLSEELQEKPAIVTFYRGGWCPYCNLQLNAYQEYLKQISAAGGLLIAISPELPSKILSTSEKNKLAYPVLSDPDNKFARALKIVFPISADLKGVYQNFGIDLEENQGNGKWELPLAATFVIDSKRVIRYAFLDTDYKKRAEPEQLVAELKKISTK